MTIFPTPIPGLMLVETTPNVDSRGAFARLYCETELNTLIGHRKVVQINYSHTATVGAIRGLHFQHAPHAEMKLVRCLKGRVWNVAIDLRHGSPTFLHWHAEELPPNNGRMMVITEGFAHGFQVIEPGSELLYLHTTQYTPSAEGSTCFDDPSLAINWPLTITNLSERDTSHLLIDEDFQAVSV